MVRQDKITFLIYTLQTPELYGSILSEEFVHNNTFKLSGETEMVLKRIGVISAIKNSSSKHLTDYIPVNKHKFLNRALLKLTRDYCKEHQPCCKDCYLSIGCDYYNKKNDWLAV